LTGEASKDFNAVSHQSEATHKSGQLVQQPRLPFYTLGGKAPLVASMQLADATAENHDIRKQKKKDAT
jgi:hypothetical protein